MKYPYYIVPQVEEYRCLDPNSEEARKLGRIIAANVGDYAALRLILGIDPPEFAKFYPDMETTTPSTMDTIDTFLDKFGGDLPDNLTLGTGLSGYVLEEEPEREETDKFENQAEYNLLEDKTDIVNDEDVEGSQDTLSNLIKGKRYETAIQFIENQNLNNPEKSIYFAHQIRFLKKLIAMERWKRVNDER